MTEQLKEFLFKFNEEFELNKEAIDVDEILSSIDYGLKPPLDSVDRVFALYLIENHKELLEVNLKETCMSEDVAEQHFNALPLDILDDFNKITSYAYENYEREGMSPTVAYFNIVSVAQNGKEFTLKDTYSEGGWFGAS